MAKTRFFNLAAILVAGFAVALAASPLPVRAQQQQEWFVPGGQQRPAQPPTAQPQPARPPQGQPARPPQGQSAGQPARPAPRAEAPAGQQPPAAVIGIVDIPEVQRVSTAFNTVREEIEKRRQRLNDDLQREQNSWREAQQNLANQRANLPAEQLRVRERELQDRITDSQRIFRERSRAIEQVAQAALMEIEQALGVVIRQVAGSRNVNLVLPRQYVIFNDPPFDLTEEIAGQFNRILRNVTIPPEPTGDAATPAAAPAPPGPRPAPAQGARPAR